ncbi:uncharacterized protein APUU_31771S [Aspergillus puulaauensis]|uniref:BHLH domain-containing protein n=1 Tax=Aspergillus puulaauensis TaxID=1220207 RepID=A0A7R8ALQ5_9EURO|nr:uncharacterized protein APUU_31771S [Aspergillus puulaauensis]BCS23546.1 hypothetical protein APUU_31771S [Aspergillus puulaauensis]
MASEYAASREDFELFRRFVRVARLLDANNFDELCNQGALTPSPSIRTGNTPRNSGGGDDDDATNGNSSSTSSSEYDDSDEEYYEDDDAMQLQGEAELDVSSTPPRISDQDTQRPPQPRSQRRQPTTRQSSTRAATATAAQRRRQQQEKVKPKRPRPHAAVEKRYRSVVNSKIQQLNALIPASNTFTPGISNGPGASEGTEGTGSQKMPTKSAVLDRGLHYTDHLIATYERYEAEGNELRSKLQQWLDISAVDGDAPGE